MVAPVNIGNVEDSFVRITDKSTGQLVQTDITQNLQNDNNPISPLNEDIDNLVANQERRLATVMETNPSIVANKDNVTTQSEESKVTVSQRSVSQREEALREQRQLIQSLSPSERRQAAMRVRAKMPLMQRPPVQLSSEEQQKAILRRLEEEVEDLKKDNYDLKKKVTMFQHLLRNREKLDKVLKKLDGKE